MNCFSLKNLLINMLSSMAITLAINVFIIWRDGSVTTWQSVMLYWLVALTFSINDIGRELTNRLKEIGGYIEEDPEYDDHDSQV